MFDMSIMMMMLRVCARFVTARMRATIFTLLLEMSCLMSPRLIYVHGWRRHTASFDADADAGFDAADAARQSLLCFFFAMLPLLFSLTLRLSLFFASSSLHNTLRVAEMPFIRCRRCLPPADARRHC